MGPGEVFPEVGQVVEFLMGNSNIEENIPLGINESLEECLAAYNRIRREADIVVPLYDPEVLVRHPRGIIA